MSEFIHERRECFVRLPGTDWSYNPRFATEAQARAEYEKTMQGARARNNDPEPTVPQLMARLTIMEADLHAAQAVNAVLRDEIVKLADRLTPRGNTEEKADAAERS